MSQPIQCGDLPRGACIQMGVIALAVPFFLSALLSEGLSYGLTHAFLWRPALLIAVLLGVVGALFALWIRARYQKNQGPPFLFWFVLLFALVIGAWSGEWMRPLLWSVAVWLGIRWLPNAIFTIGSMC
jgi:hypothetical protein